MDQVEIHRAFYSVISDRKMPSTDTQCGLSWLGHPNFLQKFATTKTFIIVYGLLGTFQAMGYVYFTMTLQTVETRFKIPSQTTGD